MTTSTDPLNGRSLDPFADLRTIPAGWDLSEFYSSAKASNAERGESLVSEPEQCKGEVQSHIDPLPG